MNKKNKKNKEYADLLKKYKALERRFNELEAKLDEKSIKDIDIPTLYTDGGYDKDKKIGAWAFGTEDKVIDSGVITKIDGTWNIQSEITACINAIKYAEAQKYSNVVIIHDLKGLKFWYEGYWKANFDSTRALKELKSQVKVKVSFKLIKGHSGIKGNELVDSQCQQLLANF